MAAPDTSLVHMFGHRETLSLDARLRFRLPDDLAAAIHQEMGRVSGHSDVPPAALKRISFYLVPGTAGRIFLYPASNISLAISRFEQAPRGSSPALVRQARDYFYSMMAFIEADRQNRLQIPEHLGEHAGLGNGERRIVLVCHNLWISICKASAAEQMDASGREALEAVGPDVLDPVSNNEQPSAHDDAPAQ